MKPSYEELEEQLNRSRRLCDAALANERVWETAMMQACGEDGPKSVAEKFAELQARCAALAAENAGMKAFGDKLSEMHNDLNGEGTGIQGRAEVACQQVALEAAMEEFDAIKTPATDDFLAEVRASVVGEVCLKISNAIINCYQDEQIGLDAAATICGDFTAQLRKGVQS